MATRILLMNSDGYKFLVLSPKNIWKDFIRASAKSFNFVFQLSGYKVNCTRSALKVMPPILFILL